MKPETGRKGSWQIYPKGYCRVPNGHRPQLGDRLVCGSMMIVLPASDITLSGQHLVLRSVRKILNGPIHQ